MDERPKEDVHKSLMISPATQVKQAAPYLIITFLFLGLISVPYLYAWLAAGQKTVFGGFLLNPMDGNTYLAKLYQGWRGDWRFSLPYTAEPGQGGYLFLFYIFLGHLARWTGISILWMFHLARWVGAVLLAIVLYWFLISTANRHSRPAALFALALLGSGLGWIAFLFGSFTSDFWVAEAYPFLSAYANPHFVLGLALLLLLLEHSLRRATRPVVLVLLALLLALVNPFCVLIAWLALGGRAAWDFLILKRGAASQLSGEERADQPANLSATFSALAWVFLGGAPLLIYAFWIIHHDPVLAGWNAQNLTPSPPAWDLLLSLSPALILAVGGIWYSCKTGNRKTRLMAAWLAAELVLIYMPLGLQRRLMTGMFVPVVGLAGIWIDHWSCKEQRSARLALTATLVLALPTNLLVLLAAFSGIQAHSSQIYLSQSEADALEWIEQNTRADALVLSSPEMGLWIPAYTGRRVIYGHPFETVNAEAEKATVTRFYSGSMTDADGFLSLRQVDYIFYGSREQALGKMPAVPGLIPVYQSAGVTIYALVND